MSGPGDHGWADDRHGEGADPDADRLIRWLAAQPRDATVVWTDPALDERTVFASEWVDVSLGGHEGPDAVLTLSAPGTAEDADDPLDFGRAGLRRGVGGDVRGRQGHRDAAAARRRRAARSR